jgi:hypothetical protein
MEVLWIYYYYYYLIPLVSMHIIRVSLYKFILFKRRYVLRRRHLQYRQVELGSH